MKTQTSSSACLLYTSDAADERSSVDLGGRRIIKKKKKQTSGGIRLRNNKNENINYDYDKGTKMNKKKK